MSSSVTELTFGALLVILIAVASGIAQAWATRKFGKDEARQAFQRKVLGVVRDNLGPLRKRASELTGEAASPENDCDDRLDQIHYWMPLIRDLAIHQVCTAAVEAAIALREAQTTDVAELDRIRQCARVTYRDALHAIGRGELRNS